MDEHSDFMLISNLYQMAQFGEVLEDLVASFKGEVDLPQLLRFIDQLKF